MKEKPLRVQQEQIEKLKDLGSRLRQLRQEQSISIEDVAAKTRIQARLLRAIEEGRWEQLPEPIYVKGFVKQFADAVGLDGADFAAPLPTWQVLPSLRPSWYHLPGSQLRPIHLYLLYVFVVIGSVNGLSYLINRSALEANGVQINKQSIAPASTSDQFQVNGLEKLGPFSPWETSKDGKNSKPVRVGVIIKDASWVRVVADGKTMFEGELPKGTQITWVADEQLTLRADNAGGVLVAFNNEKAKKLGAPGEQQEVTFVVSSKS